MVENIAMAKYSCKVTRREEFAQTSPVCVRRGGEKEFVPNIRFYNWFCKNKNFLFFLFLWYKV
jgi:hypothetical protein